MSDTQTISDDFLKDIREESSEKYLPVGVENATIIDVSEVKHNPDDGTGETRISKEDLAAGKVARQFKKVYFVVNFTLDDKLDDKGLPKVIYETYGFRIYEDTKSLWWGTEKSSCGLLIQKVKKYYPNLGKNPSFPEIKATILGKQVKITSEEFGPSKSKKIMVDSFT